MASENFSDAESDLDQPQSVSSGEIVVGDESFQWSDADEDELARTDANAMGGEKKEIGNCDTGCALECDQLIKKLGTPQSQFRRGYFTVSDFTKQSWCEMQLLYSLAPQYVLMRAPPGEEVNLEESESAKIIKGKGSDIHLERELEIQVPVEVPVETKEDKWAVKLINLQQAILSFSRGQTVAREIPVFGSPFGCGIYVFGIIDELRFDPETYSVEILELKTRKSSHPPRKQQQEKDIYQVNLYAQLFNELVEGKVTRDIVSNLGLNLDTPLSEGVMKHVRDVQSTELSGPILFGDLLDTVLTQVQCLCSIHKTCIEYVQQETKKPILMLHLDLDTEMIRHKFLEHCAWWRGERQTSGVDVEDCWKCEYCQFSSLCEWREYMANKMSKGKT